jgi:hypothetical protein
MCVTKRFEGCLKDYEHDPEECTPEQIRECHGDIEVREHTRGVERGGEVE